MSPIESLATVARLHGAQLTVHITPTSGVITWKVPGQKRERIRVHDDHQSLNLLAQAMIKRLDVCRDISVESFIESLTPTQRARCLAIANEFKAIRKEVTEGILANEPALSGMQSSLHPKRIADAGHDPAP